MKPWMGHQEYMNAHSGSRWSMPLLLMIGAAAVLILVYIALPAGLPHT